MKTPESFLTLPLIFIVIVSVNMLRNKRLGILTSFDLYLNLLALISVLVFWFPFTIVPNWFVGIKKGLNLIVSLSTALLILRFSGLNKKWFLFQYCALILLLGTSIWLYTEAFPFNISHYKEQESKNFFYQPEWNYLWHIIIFSSSIILLVIRQIRLKPLKNKIID
jgi:hypothetical protein